MLRLRVQAIDGETTCFQVESAEVQCTNPQCAKLYRRTPNGFVRFGMAQQSLLNTIGVWAKVKAFIKRMEKDFDPRYVPGAQCPKCGAVLAERWHRVDTASCNLNGHCSCEWFQFVAAKELRKLPPAEQAIGDWRCSHIDAARNFDYDVRLRLGEQYRMRYARGQKEDDTI